MTKSGPTCCRAWTVENAAVAAALGAAAALRRAAGKARKHCIVVGEGQQLTAGVCAGRGNGAGGVWGGRARYKYVRRAARRRARSFRGQIGFLSGRFRLGLLLMAATPALIGRAGVSQRRDTRGPTTSYNAGLPRSMFGLISF